MKTLPIAVAVLAIAFVAPAARADDKQACTAAYEQTQALRREGKLQAAREQAVACVRDVCAEFIRTDCSKWLAEIDNGLPSIVLEVHDLKGQDTSAAHVSLDGKPWLEGVDVKAHAVDPGVHKLRFELEGAPPIEQSVTLREGEKNKKVAVSFASPGSSSGGSADSEGAGVDGLRFRGGVGLELGAFVALDGGAGFGIGGAYGELGVQLNNMIGIYARPSFDYFMNDVSAFVVGSAFLVDFTFLDRFTIGAGPEFGAFVGVGGDVNGAVPLFGGRLHLACYPLLSKAVDQPRRSGLSIALDMRILSGSFGDPSVSSAGIGTSDPVIIISPMFSVGYAAF